MDGTPTGGLESRSHIRSQRHTRCGRGGPTRRGGGRTSAIQPACLRAARDLGCRTRSEYQPMHAPRHSQEGRQSHSPGVSSKPLNEADSIAGRCLVPGHSFLDTRHEGNWRAQSESPDDSPVLLSSCFQQTWRCRLSSTDQTSVTAAPEHPATSQDVWTFSAPSLIACR